jgi:CRISPR-associated protein Csb2
MGSQFNLSIRFLAPTFHGRGGGGEPEWPPSPLRVFQSLVAAAARRRRSRALTPATQAALQWLEAQSPPTVVAPVGVTGSGYRLSVPNNAMDIVARAWCRGSDSDTGDANPATHRTMKRVRPTWLAGGDAVHYLWPLPEPLTEEVRGHIESLATVAGSVAALGWGIDMVVGNGAILLDEQADALPGERWLASEGAEDHGLRVPVAGTLEDLIDRHSRFLARLGPDGFTAPPPLSCYATVEYRSGTQARTHAMAAFALLRLDADGFRAFDTARRALSVVGMVRHATRVAATQAGWSEREIKGLVLGHGETDGDAHHAPIGPRRFAYLPLPSIEARGQGRSSVIGSVRRVLLSSFAEGCEAEIAWARRALPGQELVDEGTRQGIALLSLIPANDSVVRHYTRSASSWATVTPVVLPGYDDPAHYRRRLERGVSPEEQRLLLGRLDDRIDGLLRKAIVQAGFPEALSKHAELEWRKTGSWPGSDLADRYGVPDHLRRFPRLHVTLHWRDARGGAVRVPGPVCLGGGRFYGLGLFAAVPSG